MPHHDYLDIEYTHGRSAMAVVDALDERLGSEQTPVILVGHSLGGVIAMNLALRQRDKVVKVVTLASPMGGIEVFSLLRWMMPHPLITDVHPSSRLISDIEVVVPTLCLVATQGHSPLYAAPNDGVVTLASQTCLTGPTYVDVPVNHFDILLAIQSVGSITDFVF